ncbi:MAG TPA: DUF4145 domain-containing protein [Rhodocyclaceae bacterium]|nr:DUF4145 domain-containing protein [Rhodocyclaceae bacterium]
MKSETFDVFCPHCNIQAEARVIANGHGGFRGEGADRFDEIDTEYHGDTYYVALCRRCQAPFLIRQSLYGIPGEFETITSEDVLFPLSSRLPVEGLPPAVRRSLEQAVRAFTSSSFDACALMCRRAIEALCKELGARNGSLQAKLESLSTQGIIDVRLANWAHGVRAVGNEAAHDTDTELSQDDARDALDFTEAILMYVYVLGSRFDAFEARRKKGGAT